MGICLVILIFQMAVSPPPPEPWALMVGLLGARLSADG